jgi:hypothetical protein
LFVSTDVETSKPQCFYRNEKEDLNVILVTHINEIYKEVWAATLRPFGYSLCGAQILASKAPLP